MKVKYLLFVSTLFLSILATAQEFYGKAVYHSAVNLDIQLDSNAARAGQQEEFEKRLKQAMQKDQELLFDRYASLYREVESLEKDGQGLGMKIFASITNSGGTLYKHTKTMESIRQTEFFSKLFLVKDTLEKPDWKLEKESKQIGKYTCFKASMIRRTIEKKLSSVNGEESMTEDTVDVLVTAWYTPQIPVSTGPDEYFGLPGLILEINDGRVQMLCTQLVLNPKEKIEIQQPEKGQVVSKKEYEAIVTEKLMQMKQMYQGEGRGRGNGSIKIRTR